MTDMPTMRAAFRTTVSGGGKYEMVFRFPTMDAMHAADDEWRAALPIPEAPASVVDREITTKPVAVGETAAGVTQSPASVEPVEAKYLICKGGAYYRPNAQGYTRNRAKAGRYTLEEAISYSHPNGPDGPRDGITYELDTAPPSPGFGGGDLREAIHKALSSELGDTYDCGRVWDAWHVGTMGEDDFTPVNDRVDEITETILAALSHDQRGGAGE